MYKIPGLTNQIKNQIFSVVVIHIAVTGIMQVTAYNLLEVTNDNRI